MVGRQPSRVEHWDLVHLEMIERLEVQRIVAADTDVMDWLAAAGGAPDHGCARSESVTQTAGLGYGS